MPKFFCDNINNDIISILGEDAKHIAKSLRCKTGEALSVGDGRGTDYHCEIVSVSDSIVEAKILTKEASIAELPVKAVLYQALPKGDKLDLIVQKAVELGAAAVVPVYTEFCVSRPDEKSMKKKTERLNRIALEAAKQCGRGVIPEVMPALSFKEAVKDMKNSDKAIMFYECSHNTLNKELPEDIKSISVMVGSEGGFSKEEADYAEKEGITLCTMGNRILRCETAAIYSMSAVSFKYENCK